MLAVVALLAPLLLERIPAGAGAIEVSLARECKGNCPLLLKLGSSQLAVSDLALPPGGANSDSGQWTLEGGVTLSLRPLQLGQKTPAVLIESLHVPEGAGRAVESIRVVAAVGATLKLALSFDDPEAGMGIGQVTMADQVLHIIHDNPGSEQSADAFDDAAWDWSGSEMRRLTGATLFAVALAVRPALDKARKLQHAVESKCPLAGRLRSYATERFESIPQEFFAGKIFLRRAEAQSLLEAVRPCAPAAEIVETAYLPR